MKKLLTILMSLLLLVIVSCDRPKHHSNLAFLLEYAKSPVIVIAIGTNEGNFESGKYYTIFKDADNIIYEYYGANYTFEIGDTIK